MTARHSRRTIAAAAAAAFVGRQLGAAAQETGREAANGVLVRRLFDEVYNRGDIDVADELLAEDFRPQNPEDEPGIDAFKQRQRDNRRGREAEFDSVETTIDILIASGESVFTRGLFLASRESRGRPNISVTYLTHSICQDGRIYQVVGIVDPEVYLDQLAD